VSDKKGKIFGFDRDLFFILVIMGFIGVVLLLVSIVIGTSLEDGAEKPLYAIFFKELGFALIIAVLLAFSVERAMRSRHEKAAQDTMEAINKNLFKAVYDRYIPPEVFSEVERCLMTCDIVRKEYQIDYTLSYIEHDDFEGISQGDKDSHLKCDIFSKYVIENVTDSTTDVPIELHLEKPIDSALSKFLEVKSVSIGDWTIKGDQIKDYIEDAKEHLIFKTNKEISARGEVEVSMVARVVKRKVDAEIWASRLPSNDITLRVRSPRGVEVFATANHSQSLKVSDSSDFKVYELKHGVFPFQSVIFWWKESKVN